MAAEIVVTLSVVIAIERNAAVIMSMIFLRLHNGYRGVGVVSQGGWSHQTEIDASHSRELGSIRGVCSVAAAMSGSCRVVTAYRIRPMTLLARLERPVVPTWSSCFKFSLQAAIALIQLAVISSGERDPNASTPVDAA